MMRNIEGSFVRILSDKVGRIRSRDGFSFKLNANRADLRRRTYCKNCPLAGRCQPESEVRRSTLSLSKYFIRVKGYLAGTEGCGLVFPQRRKVHRSGSFKARQEENGYDNKNPGQS